MPPPLLLSCESIAKQYGPRPLFEKLSFGLYEGDRVGLVGPNGAGKSTFLRILAGLEDADVGTRALKKGLRVGYLAQDPTFSDGATVESAMLEALGDLPLEEFEKTTRAALALGRLGFRDFDQPVAILSGGWRKRLGLARELAREPDVLLLDEPTNHLDLDGILELEELLQSAPFAFIAASHDRYFLESIAKRMLELDRNDPEGLLQVDGNYSALLEKRDEERRNQAEYQEVLANRARREVEWLRRGPKARTTKSKSRIDRAHQLLDELAAVKERTVEATAGIDLASSGRKTKRLLVAEGISKAYGDRTLFEGLDLLLRPGTRLGLLGANGSGKSTLLALLAGTLEPDSGKIERAQFLNTVLFEQSRETLDRTVSLRRALAPDSDSVIYQDRPIHVAAWAKRFLFRTEQLDTPVSRLSGGEQARILIARLMLRPADLLILDEPTNDLDIPTLEVLEESLIEFPGALVLVTHDRYLLDRVSTEILALDGAGNVESFADTAQWAARDQTPKLPKAPAGKSASSSTPAPATAAPRTTKRKLTYSEQKELEGMEAAILEAEGALGRAQAATEEPGIQTDASELHKRYEALDLARREVERLWGRWGMLTTS